MRPVCRRRTPGRRTRLRPAQPRLGDIASEINNLESAKTYYSLAIEALQALFYAEPSNNLYRQMLATDYGNYGRILMDLEELEAAEPFFEQESSLSQLLTAIDPQNRDYAFGRVLAHKNLGDYYFRINDPSSGAEQYQSALAKSETLWEHLVGSQFTRAALAAASLLSPLAVPEPHHTCYAALFPPNVAKDARAWAERPAIVWVRDTYRRYRQ